MTYVIKENISAIKRKPVNITLYLMMSAIDIYFVSPTIFNMVINANITNRPFEAPSISALLKDICEDIHIDKNKNI